VIDLDHGPIFVDRIDELRIPCASAAEYVRNATVDEDCPVHLRDLQLVVHYQDDMDNMWTHPRDWRGLREAVLDWRDTLASEQGIATMQAEVWAWSSRWAGFYALAGNLAAWPGFAGSYGPMIAPKRRLFMALQDQVGLFALWMARYRALVAPP
jgi:hypothetical protein